MNFNNVKLEISAGSPKQFLPRNLPEIAFSGKSNVGKSSLINCILNRKSLARVSATPGKTVTVNFYNIDNSCRFVDLPGYGYAKVSKDGQDSWSPVVERYFTDENRCDLVFQLLDIRHKISENDKLMLNYLNSLGISFVAVLTKADKLKKNELEKMMAYFDDALKYSSLIKIVPFSSENRMGRNELISIIEDISGYEVTGAKL